MQENSPPPSEWPGAAKVSRGTNRRKAGREFADEAKFNSETRCKSHTTLNRQNGSKETTTRTHRTFKSPKATYQSAKPRAKVVSQTENAKMAGHTGKRYMNVIRATRAET